MWIEKVCETAKWRFSSWHWGAGKTRGNYNTLRERILFIQCACFYLQFWKSLMAGFFFPFPILVVPKVAYFWQNVHYWLGVCKEFFARELSKQKSVKTNILVWKYSPAGEGWRVDSGGGQGSDSLKRLNTHAEPLLDCRERSLACPPALSRQSATLEQCKYGKGQVRKWCQNLSAPGSVFGTWCAPH